MNALKNTSESARLVRRYKSGSLPILAPAGTLRLSEVMWQSMWPTCLFLFVLVMQIQPYRFDHGLLTDIVTGLGVALVLIWPFLALFVYTAGIFKTAQNSVARSSAVLFWIYWPFWRFVVCVTAVALAYSLGGHLWFNNFQLYEEYYRLQAYSNVDSYVVSGTRLQDSGLIEFNQTNGVDRSKAGCIVNGHTYCVAPIIRGGEVKPGEKQAKDGVNDLFMAGIDCCNCPVTDFHCGDWYQQGKTGGMRLLNDENRKMFRLAAEKWAVDFNKVTLHSIFFEWVNEPVAAWKKLWTRGLHLAILACLGAILGFFLINVVLNGFMRLLKDLQLAAPLDDTMPMLPGLSFNHPLKQSFVPDEYRSYLTQQDPRGDADAKFVIL